MRRSSVAAQIVATPNVPQTEAMEVRSGPIKKFELVSLDGAPVDVSEPASSGEYTLKDILNQPAEWQRVLAAVKKSGKELRSLVRKSEAPVFAGSGPEFNAAVLLSQVCMMALGKKSYAVPLGEVSLDSGFGLKHADSLVVFARSGDDPWAGKAVDCARRAGMPCAVVSSGAPVEAAGVMAIGIESAAEDRVGPMSSFTSLVLAGLGLALGTEKCISEAPDYGAALLRVFLRSVERVMSSLAEGCPQSAHSKYIFVASPPFTGLAMQSQFWALRMARAFSHWVRAAEFEPGAGALVDESTLVVVLTSDSFRDVEIEVAERARELGAKTLVLCDALDGGFVRQRRAADRMMEVSHRLKGHGGPEECRGLLYALVVQLLSYYAALARGLDPDQAAS